MIARVGLNRRRLRADDKIACALALSFTLAPIVAPAVIVSGAAALRSAQASPSPFSPQIDAASSISPQTTKLTQRIPASPFAVPPSASVAAPLQWASIPGAAPIRSGQLRGPAAAVVAKAAAPAQSPGPSPATDSTVPWVMEHFASAHVLDGLRINAGSLVFTLADVRPPASGAVCRRLDGVLQSCLTRADNRLSVLVRGRPLSCEIFRDPVSGGMRGRCKAGQIDLAADLVRNGLARPG